MYFTTFKMAVKISSNNINPDHWLAVVRLLLHLGVDRVNNRFLSHYFLKRRRVRVVVQVLSKDKKAYRKRLVRFHFHHGDLH